MMSDFQWVAIYWDSYNIYFALYLHCISLMIALHVQLQLKRGYENFAGISVNCSLTDVLVDGDCMLYSLCDLVGVHG